LKLPGYIQWAGTDDDTHGNIGIVFGNPAPSALTLAGQLLVCEEYSAMPGPSICYFPSGIVVGTVNRLQLNKWRAYWLGGGFEGFAGRLLWQLIAIFDKVNEFPVPGNLVLKKPAPAAGGQQLATDRFTHKKRN